MDTWSIIDIFAGAGGLSLGFQQTGRFNVRVAIEKNRNAQNTYIQNHPGVEMYSDVVNVDYKAILEQHGPIDVVIGGPPCQGFSNANRQKNDLISGNNQLVKEYVRSIEDIKPKAFVMENVKSMASDKHKFFLSLNDAEEIKNLGLSVNIEEFQIGETVWFPELISFIQQTSCFKQYLLPEKIVSKLGILYRRVKKGNLTDTHEILSIRGKFKDWDNVHSCTWSCQYEDYWKSLKELLAYYFDHDYSQIQSLLEKTEAVINTQKILLKMQEIVDNNICPYEVRSDNKNRIWVKVKTYNVLKYLIRKLEFLGYKIDHGILNAANFGVPQLRERLFIIGIKEELLTQEISLPSKILEATEQFLSIEQAIKDLEIYVPDKELGNEPKLKLPNKSVSKNNYFYKYVNDVDLIHNHIITDTTKTAMERFKCLNQGENFHHLKDSLKNNTYSHPERTQNTIYQRLKYDELSGTVLNARKSMWIHPVEDRAISIREVARLQSFPDSFIFVGGKNNQYQQIGNAVPPLLARAVAERIIELLGGTVQERLRSIIFNKL